MQTCLERVGRLTRKPAQKGLLGSKSPRCPADACQRELAPPEQRDSLSQGGGTAENVLGMWGEGGKDKARTPGTLSATAGHNLFPL